MKHLITKSIMLLSGIALIFGFTFSNDEGKVHLKVIKEENGQKSVFEKSYDNMEALKSDDELKAFDLLIQEWTNDRGLHTHSFDVTKGDGKKIIIKKKMGDGDDLTWVTKGDDSDGEKHIIIKKKGDDDEVIEIKEAKVIEIDSEEGKQTFTIKIDEEGEHNMVWVNEDGDVTKLTDEKIDELIQKHNDEGEEIHIKKKIEVIVDEEDGEKNVIIMKGDSDGDMVWVDEDGNETKLTEEKIAELKEKHDESGNAHKKVQVIVSDEGDEKKNVIIMNGADNEVAEIKVDVEVEEDEDGNKVIKDKKVWITKDGEKVELDDENSFQFKTEGDDVTVIVDGKTLDLADFSGGKFEGDKDVFVMKKGEGKVKQTMNVNVEDKNGETFIEINIKRDAAQNVTISEIEKADASLEDVSFSLKNNLKPSQLNYYPNPNNGKFNLKFNLERKGEVTVKVLDILGNEVYKEKILDFNGIYENQLDLAGHKKGVYVLQVLQDKKALSRKILIE